MTFRPSRNTCLVLASLLLVFGAFARNAADRFAPIASALQNGEFGKALELLRPALQTDPGNPQLWAMQGTAYAGEGHKNKALASFHNALKISADYIPALEGAIQIEFERSDPAAIPLLQRMIRLRPEDATSHAMLAVLEYQRGECISAVPQFAKAGAIIDSQLAGLHAYAACLVKLKQPDKAAAVFQRALALDPDDPKERQLLAAIQLMAHDPENALATLAPLLQGNDPQIETLELASAAYEAGKDTSRAVSTLRQAILLDPRNVNLYLDFTNICYEHGSFQVGIDVINDGLGLSPKLPRFILRAAFSTSNWPNTKKQRLTFRKPMNWIPTSLSARRPRDWRRRSRTISIARSKECRHLLARKPADPLMLYLQADILAAKNADPGSPDFQLAIRSARKAVSLQPSLAAARGVLAKLYLQAGLYPQAIEQCRKALESNPTDQATVYHLIQALRKTGAQGEIPDLLKRLALLREQALKKDKERYQYKLVDDDTQH